LETLEEDPDRKTATHLGGLIWKQVFTPVFLVDTKETFYS
jgi:hypothetical protein